MLSPERPVLALAESDALEGSNEAHSANSILERVAQRLIERSPEDAVRLFLDAQDKQLLSTNGELLDDLLDFLGRDLTAQLISAMAHFPCPACKDGLEPCYDCEAKGVRYEGAVCETCLGTARTACSFCGGSGLATYATVPISLQYPMLAKRVNMLSRRIAPLLGLPLPETVGDLVGMMLSLNKILLTFDDAVIASEPILLHDANLSPAVEQLLQACRSAPQQLQPRMRSILRKLAELARQSGDSHRADFYNALANSQAFKGTGLHHPMLGG